MDEIRPKKSRAAKRPKVLLVNPTAPEWRMNAEKAPNRRTKLFRFSMLSSLSVSAAMPPHVETQIIDEDVEPIDFGTDADIIGISFMTFNAPRAYEVADRFHDLGKTVIFGGFHPTFMPEEAAEHADAVCIGEAEESVPRMIGDFVSGRLKRFYRSGPVDLRGLKAPDRSLIKKSAYVTPDAVQATRGCPNRCKFCSITAFHRHSFRMRPVEEVVAELEGLGRNVVFMDDNIAADRGYAKELFSKMSPLGKRWFSQCTVGIANDNELLRLASGSGCRGMFVGLESISQENLVACNKGFNRAEGYTRAIEKIHAAGIGVYAGVVFGMDGDRPDVFQKTLAFLDDAKVDALQATILTPFPGTRLYAEMEREGRIFDKDWSKYNFSNVVFEPEGMSAETLKKGHDYVLSAFYSKRSIARRLSRACRYVSPWMVLRLGAVNLNYRSRLTANGTIEAESRGREARSRRLDLVEARK
jgi:radical SAM superfamily enzyme YgiQ (UPF0313 family)